MARVIYSDAVLQADQIYALHPCQRNFDLHRARMSGWRTPSSANRTLPGLHAAVAAADGSPRQRRQKSKASTTVRRSNCPAQSIHSTTTARSSNCPVVGVAPPPAQLVVCTAWELDWRLLDWRPVATESPYQTPAPFAPEGERSLSWSRCSQCQGHMRRLALAVCGCGGSLRQGKDSIPPLHSPGFPRVGWTTDYSSHSAESSRLLALVALGN
mmetsp:Transcript_28124/g.51415  ORF Transcript_28124/g.51415 Transcript_28124/m.51415 type:complete len:213 (+) Transcript_28124:635-1273(+)